MLYLRTYEIFLFEPMTNEKEKIIKNQAYKEILLKRGQKSSYAV